MSLFEPAAPSDPARYQSITETLERDREHGTLRLRGPALAWWVKSTPKTELRDWVMDQLDARIERNGWTYTTVGYVRTDDIGKTINGYLLVVSGEQEERTGAYKAHYQQVPSVTLPPSRGPQRKQYT